MASIEYVSVYPPSYERSISSLDNKRLACYKLVTLGEPQDLQVMPTDNYEHADTTTVPQTLRGFRGGSARRSAKRGNGGIMKTVKKLFT
ncbi:hypothetical protein ZYGR_0AL00520 [Zygosaccharomyces rouxii]|uniref:Uncharacterized protein n=1 Tax=Zygosaccharomyces rouxii TaxID=4956 RepID=A0A1Q3AF97_ZYGRO|nr:hypothetical protein ZYGR_0AL00520 [Zygosaccharomyces rouxii]